MVAMLQSSGMLFLLLAAATIATVASHDCAFVPQPLTTSNDTAVIQVDCNRRQPHADELSDTGDSTGLVVYLVNCTTVPVGLFVNASAKLSSVAVVSGDSEVLLEGTFEGLQNVAELRLEGFQTLASLSSAVFRPLRRLERLLLVGFGADKLKYVELAAALSGLSGTPLSRIVMHEIHSGFNEKILNVNEFQIQNVSVRELVFSNNIVTGFSGRLSQVLPDLEYFCVGMNARYYAAMNMMLDAWLFLPRIHEMVAYAYPEPNAASSVLPDSKFAYSLDSAIWLELTRYYSADCHIGLHLPLNPSLRRLTMRNFQLMDVVIHKPICFHDKNNVEYLDVAGSPLATNFTQITGLNRLQYLDMQNTKIVKFSHNFFRYFPSLKVVNLGQLSIGKSMKHINSSFFGNCPTLTEIHLGDCQLTTIPATAFVDLPALETLNFSSNSLRSFDISLSANGNLSHLNLSRNIISTLSEDVLAELNAVAQRRLQAGDRLTVDLRRNPLSCLCNSSHFVRQLQDWVTKREVHVPGFEGYRCLYPNGSKLELSRVDVDQLLTDCQVLTQVENGSDCPCDDDIRRRLGLVRLSLHGYVCRRPDGKLVSMAVQLLPSCPDFFASATFIAPVVVGSGLAMVLTITLVFLYRHRKDERLHRIIERVGMSRIARLVFQHDMTRHYEKLPSSFTYDVFLYIQEEEDEAVRHLFDVELCAYRKVRKHDDFSVGYKLETLLENIQTCRWLVPVLSPNFVNDGNCCHFIRLAQHNRPHAIVPVVWNKFRTDIRTINNLDAAEPVKWPGDEASDLEKETFWNTLLERTSDADDSAATMPEVYLAT